MATIDASPRQSSVTSASLEGASGGAPSGSGFPRLWMSQSPLSSLPSTDGYIQSNQFGGDGVQVDQHLPVEPPGEGTSDRSFQYSLNPVGQDSMMTGMIDVVSEPTTSEEYSVEKIYYNFIVPSAASNPGARAFLILMAQRSPGQIRLATTICRTGHNLLLGVVGLYP